MQEAAKIGQIKIGMSVATGQLDSGLKKAGASVAKFKSETDQTLSKIGRQIESLRTGSPAAMTGGGGMKPPKMPAMPMNSGGGYQQAKSTLTVFSEIGNVITGINQAWGIFSRICSTIFQTVSAIVSTMARIAKYGFGLAADAESAQVSFSVLLKSQAKAAKLVEQINQYSMQSSVGGKENIQNAARTMLAFGLSGEKVMPSIKALGEIAAGNSERFTSLALAFSQCQAAGRLMGQDLLQFVNAGFSPLQQISKDTGISIGDLKKKMEEGAISSDMVTAAFMRATQKGGLFYGMNERVSKTLNGMTEMINSKAILAFTKYSEAIVKALDIRSIMSNFIAQMDASTQAVSKFTNDSTQFINTYKATWVEGFKAAGAAVKSLIDIGISISPMIMDIGLSINDVVKWVFDLKGSWKDTFIDMQLNFRLFVNDVKISVLQLQKSMLSMMKFKEMATNWGGNKNGIIQGFSMAEGAIDAEINRLGLDMMQIGIDFAKQQIKAPEIDWSPWTDKYDQLKKEMPALFGEDSWAAQAKQKWDGMWNKTKAFDSLKKGDAKKEFIQPFAENDYFHPSGKTNNPKKDQKVPKTEFASLAFAGSREARDAILNNKFGGNKDDTAKNTKDTVITLKTTNTLIKKQIDNASSNNSVTEVSFV